MIEKLSDYEGSQYLSEAGKFVFTVENYELTSSANGNIVAKFEVKCDKGTTTIYHSLNQKARWSYNSLIKACLHLNTADKIAKFELDYETIGQQLIGTKFIGNVVCENYTKDISTPNDDGTFTRGQEVKETYKIKSYEECK